MKILFVASRFLYPPQYGDQVRGFHHLRILSRRHQIVLLTPCPDKTQKTVSLDALKPYCEQIHFVSVPTWRRYMHLLKLPFTKVPMQTIYVYDNCFQVKAQELLNSQTFDLIHVQTIRMALILKNLMSKVPAVLDFIDALSMNMAQRARRRLSPQMLVACWESRRIFEFECAMVKQYNQSVISSPIDREVIGDFTNLHVVPNGVDLEVHPFYLGKRDSAKIIFTGTMWYFPNIDAVVWFVKEVFPLVRKQIPKLRFLIVGARPVPIVRRLERVPGVVVTGFVPDIQDYLSRAIVAIAPMQSGSGMQFKVIEAMANGAPVVATPFALGGLEAVDGEHLLIARNAKDFASAIVRVIKDTQLRNYLTKNARKLVEEKYGWERTVETLESVYRVAIEKHENRQSALVDSKLKFQ
jgi:sugar transferase (PEP-CTERM/EpsH1 system associated)